MMADGTQPSAAGTRRRRIPAREVRERMLAAAQAMVLEMGVTVSLDDVSLEDVMRRADVPRSSVYRLWPYKGDFIDDLLCYLAAPIWVEPASPPSQQRALNLALEVVRANQHRLVTAAGRRAVTREAARRAVAQNFQDMVASSGSWLIHLALAATVNSVRNPRARARIAAALQDAERARVDSLVRFYRVLAQMLGLRVREGYRFEHLAVAGGMVVQGLMMRQIIARNAEGCPPPAGSGQSWSLDALINDPLPGPGLDGGTAEWSFAAAAYLGIFEHILEPDPDSPFSPPEAVQPA